jgi:CBS domain-containing protein
MYLSGLLGTDIRDSAGNWVADLADLAIPVGEVFPRVVALCWRDADGMPRMVDWRATVATVAQTGITLALPADQLEYTYLKEEELLVARDLMERQIVDMRTQKVRQVADLKFNDTGTVLRLMGAEIQTKDPDNLIPWNYIDLPGRDLGGMKLTGSHRRMGELHPADVADIIEQLDPETRAAVFAHLDTEQAAEAISELEDEYQAELIEELPEDQASDLLAEMDPDDAVDIIADLDTDKAERLLQQMGYEDSETIRHLMGFEPHTAGGIMTPEVAVATLDMTVADTIAYLRKFARDANDLHYVYLVDGTGADGTPDPHGHLTGVVSLFQLLMNDDATLLADFAKREVISANAADDQEDVADTIGKYNLLALPVVDDDGRLLGTVTVDDALDVMEEEAEEDLALATGQSETTPDTRPPSLIRRIGRAMRWLLPQSIAWPVIWLLTALVTIFLNVELSMRDTGMTETSGFDAVAYTGIVLSMLVWLMPLTFTTLRAAVLRAVGRLTSVEPDRRPTPARRYLAAAALGLGSAVLCGLLLTALVFAGGSYIEPTDLMLYLVSPIPGSVLAALITAWLVNKAVADDDAGTEVKISQVYTFGMIAYVLLVPPGILLVIYNAIRLGLY